ncbi:hypothetical protein [Ponticoccus litoralis]|uniref:SCP2 domain-containing protein n=1 Tax=Ponticoccus litoralis TaxID=422297 RepID=A0AAW9SMG7_9RHOB
MLETIEAMRQELGRTPHLVRLGRLFSDTVLLQVDEAEYYLHFEKGALARVETGPSRKIAWRFAIRTDAEALRAFWTARPAPGFHDLFGLVKIERARIDGDILSLVKNLRFFKEFLALGRGEARA